MSKFFRHLALMALMSVSLVSASFAGDAKAPRVVKAHRVAIQVDQNDSVVMNLALNNATNVIEYYRAKGENVDVDIVTYGPGLQMLRVDASPVQDRIKHLKDLAFPGKIQFSACNNTKAGMEKKEGRTIALLPEASIVPSGVVRLVQLQEQGWSYVRP
jgi:intracellular sulfur oxidation DsrE/DsrF family protein